MTLDLIIPLRHPSESEGVLTRRPLPKKHWHWWSLPLLYAHLKECNYQYHSPAHRYLPAYGSFIDRFNCR